MSSYSRCPVCERGSLNLSSTEVELPYYGKAYIITLICEICAFRITDVVLSKVNPPTSYYAKIDSVEDLKIKVVKSSTGIIRIPEMGVKMEPGPVSQGFITNIEGILQRVEDVTIMVKGWLTDERKLQRCNQLLEKISKAVNGEFEFTFIIEDPLGNSMLVGEPSQIIKKRKLSERQINKMLSKRKS
ncbi:MAG: ZPR1 zinc finger domain-containing protein [Candidatus Odinarchaeum yellowstonii]|uniref:ZPR1 zinc finger domain-containing protein n=1 Tax=Odinarchaeota yellowstonii (strain LCB_4) TaxID=1841599 RepID=A0AAF0I9V1_ODILC|nr:MAG: ZPR1 zinc finger domain-containing protein [Candidatus Odinarchaeum yellowstonii]